MSEAIGERQENPATLSAAALRGMREAPGDFDKTQADRRGHALIRYTPAASIDPPDQQVAIVKSVSD